MNVDVNVNVDMGARADVGVDVEGLVTVRAEAICHLVGALDWASGASGYRPASVDTEGFIHFSTPGQVVETANLFYPGRDDLLLLVVDPARLTGELRWEAPAGAARRDGQRFPHLYGAAGQRPMIDEVALLAVHHFPLPPGGRFTELPDPLVPATEGPHRPA